MVDKWQVTDYNKAINKQQIQNKEKQEHNNYRIYRVYLI